MSRPGSESGASRPRDSLWSSRAIFIEQDLLGGLSPAAAGQLEALAAVFRIVAVGDGVPAALRGRVRSAAVRPQALPQFAKSEAIEMYSSWIVGAGDGPGYGGLRRADGAGGLAAALTGIREHEQRSRIIIDDRGLGAAVAALRQRGARIIFTNGVFDLVHIGHLRLLERARALGDALIVGINSDDSTRRIKGPSRPIVAQFARAETLVSLRAVDYCVVFTEKDPKRLLAAIRPHVLAKGCDYPLNRVVGRRLVLGYGGEVVRLPFVDGSSTTATITRIVLQGGARRGH